jgi:hypothetical protein
MAREPDAGRADDAVQSRARVLVLGVDAADPRALLELTRRLPTDGTTLHSVPALADWAGAERDPRRNPPGAIVAALNRLRGARPDAGALAALLDAAVADLGEVIDEIDTETDRPALPRSRWWSVGTWTATALALAVPIAGIAAALLSGGVLGASFATLGAIAAIAQFVGFGLARQAAAIRRHDAVAADSIATAVGGNEGEHVVVVPARNAAGVAAALRERGIDAEAHRIPPDDASDAGA